MHPGYPPYPEPDDDGLEAEPESVDPAAVPAVPQPEPEPEPTFRSAEPLRGSRSLRNGAGLGQRIAGPLGGEEPRQRPSSERAFRIVEVRFGSDGDLRAQIRKELTTKIYRGGTAMRFTQHEAKLMEPNEAVLLLVRPTGGFAGVWLTGSGRRAHTRLAGKCRRLVRELLPELFFRRRRRTSRRASGGKKLKRRTSRASRTRRRGRRTSRRNRRRRSRRRR